MYDSSARRPSSVSPPDPFDVCHKRGQHSRADVPRPPARPSIIACLLSALVYIISPPTKEEEEEEEEEDKKNRE